MERKLQGEFGCSPGRLQNTPTKNTVLFLEPWVRKNSDPNDICFTFPSFLEVWDYCLLIFRPHHFVYFLDTIGQPFANLPPPVSPLPPICWSCLRWPPQPFGAQTINSLIVLGCFVGFKTWNDQCSCPPVLSFGVRLYINYWPCDHYV